MSFGEFYAATSGIGKAYKDGLEENRQRTGLAMLGQQIQTGDYGAAASTAFDLGDTQTGVGLLKLGQSSKQQQLEQQAGAEFVKGLGALGSFGAGGVEAQPQLGVTAGNARALPSFADSDAPSGSYVANLFKRESNNNPNAQASTSSAKGLGQFTDRTWAGVMRSHPELGLTADGRTDPDQMLRATNAFTADNERGLQRAGLPVNDATRYASHFLGASGGPRFVAGTLRNPDVPAANYVQPDQVAANRRIFFNRDGTPKTAGQVMNDFGSSFGGGSQQVATAAPRPQRVAYADNEDQTQALEQRMGMMPPARASAPSMPTQVAQAPAGDPRADMPMEGAQTAEFYIPGTEPAPVPDFPPGRVRQSGLVSPATSMPSTSVDARPSPIGQPLASNQPAAPGGSGGAPGRVMQMPGAPPPNAPEAIGGGQAPVVADANATVGNMPVAAIAQSPLSQRIPFLIQAAAMPNLAEPQRQLAQTLLKQALDEGKMSDQVKEYLFARSQGFKGSPIDYRNELRKPLSPTTVSPGQAVIAPGERAPFYTAPAAEKADRVTADIDARKSAAADNGLVPGSPAYQSFVLTGKMPREDAQPLTAGDKKAIQDADTAVLSSQSTIDMLKQAKELSKKAYEGPLAGYRGMATSLVGSEGGVATQDLDNLVTTQALQNLKAIFGGNPTEGERAILLEIQGSSAKPDVVRQRIYDRAIGLANLRMQQNQEKAAELRGQTYYKPGSGPRGQGAQPNAAQPPQRALPAPSQANRPGAVPAQDRYGQLVGSGMTKAQAYEQMHSEGY